MADNKAVTHFVYMFVSVDVYLQMRRNKGNSFTEKQESWAIFPFRDSSTI